MTDPSAPPARPRRIPVGIWVGVGLGALGAAIALIIVAGGISGAAQPVGAVEVASVHSASPTPGAATPSTAEPLDPDAVTTAQSGPAVAAADTAVTSRTALDVLAALPVKGKAAATGYQRTTDFGTAWLDVDRNGCDTRNDILARDLTDLERPGGCRVLSGTLRSAYTGATIAFVRGAGTSALVQIDHIVPLQNAWITGAQRLTQAQRVSLANDPLNLIAVDARSNEQKSSGDAATWLPANTAFRCEYVARQISVKATYGLWVTSAEKAAMTRVLAGCRSQSAESSAFTPAAPAPAASYANCDAVRAAGAAPLLAGQPGYSHRLDRDGDGIACE